MKQFELFTLSSLTLLLLLTIIIACYIMKRLKSGGGDTSPPSPPTLPVIGNLHQLGQLPHRSLAKLSTKYGPLILLHLGRNPVFVVSSAHITKEMFRTHDLAFADKPVTNSLKKIFYDGNDVINLPYGERWRKLRRIMVNEVLSNARVKSFDSIREEEMALFVKKIEESCSSSSRAVLNLSEMLAELTNDLICLAAFGKKYSEGEHGKKFLEAVDGAVEQLGKLSIGDFIPWLAWVDRLSGRDAALDRVAKNFDEALDAIIEDHLNSSRTNREDIVDILLGIYKGEIADVSIDLLSVKGVILDIFGAGTETSSTSLAWMMTELIRHPNVMKTLQDEIRGIMEGKHHITNDDLKKMHYLKAVIKETFRLHTPVPIFSRVAREKVNLMGYEIAPRTTVMINSSAIARDPTYWDSSEKFMPERFLNSSIDFKGFHFQLTPFGGGRRICPGMEFATISIEHTIANLMLKFDWALPYGAKGEDLDATERQGFTIGRKTPLLVVATVHSKT